MIQFIGRRKELERLKNAVIGNLQIMCIEGGGGLGKTRLLTQLNEELSQLPDITICEIIDFDNPRFHVTDMIAQEIARQLGESFFEEFFLKLEHKFFLENHQASPDRLAYQEKLIRNELIIACNKACKDKKLVLRFDATDNLKGNLVPIEYICWLSKQLKNICIIIAGRDSSKVLQVAGIPQEDRSEYVLNIEPLSPPECREYLDTKLSQRLLSMDEASKEKLVSISIGRIILLDVAVEWLLFGPFPEWLKPRKGEKEDYSESELLEFERHLFEHVRFLRNNTDRLLLLLSKVYPLDREGIKELLSLSDDEINDLMLILDRYTFIKKIPDGYIKLHDEIERLINAYIWPLLPEKRLTYTLKSAISYLSRKTTELIKIPDQSREVQHTLYLYLVLHLRHQMRLDLGEGYLLYKKYSDLAARTVNSFSLRALLLTEMLPFLDKLDPEQKIELSLAEADYLLREEKYEVAVETYLNPILSNLRQGGRNSIAAELEIKRGIAYARMGSFNAAIKDFLSVIEISQTIGRDDLQASSKLQLAEINRFLGNLVLATKDYLEVIAYSLAGSGDDLMLAKALGDLAVISALQGNHRDSQFLINRSVQLIQNLYQSERLSNDRLGESYFNAAVVYSMLGRFQQAQDYFDLSLNETPAFGIEEWQAKIKGARGVLLWMQKRDNDAEIELELAMEKSPKLNIGLESYCLGNVKWGKGDRKSAELIFQEGLRHVSKKRDAYIEMLLLCGISRLAFEKEIDAFPNWQSFNSYLEGYQIRYPNANFQTIKGALLTHLGHLAAKSRDDLAAKKFYIQGLPLLTKLDYTYYLRDLDLYSQLSFIHNKVTRIIGVTKTKDLGITMSQIWQDKDLELNHPGAQLFFSSWKQGCIPYGLR